MSSDKKGNNAIEKLRILLDNGAKKLHPKDGKYLHALHRRLERASTSHVTYSKRTAPKEQDDIDELLKPRVVIHQKEQPKIVEFPEVHSEVEEQQQEESKSEHIPKEDGLIEVEKVEVEGPEFIEVTPKELPKKKEEATKKEKQFEELPQETKDIEEEVVEEIPPEKAIPEWEPLPEEQEKEEVACADKKTTDDEFFEDETLVEEEIEEKPVEVVEEAIFKEEDLKEDDLSEWETDSEKEIKEEIIGEEKTTTEEEFGEEKETPAGIEEEEKKEGVFAGVNSVDEKIAQLLQENGITSIEMLRETPIKKLTRIKGIKRKIAKKIKKEIDALPVQKQTTEDDEWQIVDMKEDTSDDFEEIGESSAKQRVEDNPLLEEEEWETFTEESVSEKEQEYHHGEYTLYEKEIETKTGKKRTVRFFSKGEPEEGKAITLPEGYAVKVNKRTGVPYLKKE